MTKIAQELNNQLDTTLVGQMLSDIGRRMFFPRGIVAQSAEAMQKAQDLNATIGMACVQKKPYTLPLLQKMLPDLSTQEMVAYAPTAGIPALRQKWRELLVSKNPLLNNKEMSNPIVVAGITSGIFQMAELFVDSQDSIILPDVYWGNYRLTISERRGGIISTYPLYNAEGGFNVEGLLEQIQNCIEQGQKKVILIFNFPNNPTGYSVLQSEVLKICDTLKNCADKGLRILTVHDDAYFGLFYDDLCFKQSLFAYCADLHPNILALKIDGATKEDFAWGFRVAFMTFASQSMTERDFDPLIQKVMGSIRASVSNCSSIGQNLLLRMLCHPNYIPEQNASWNLLCNRYTLVKKVISDQLSNKEGSIASKLLKPLPFNSGYFMAFGVQLISAEELRLELLKKGIGTIAVGESILRVAYSTIDAEEIPRLYTSIFESAQKLYESQ